MSPELRRGFERLVIVKRGVVAVCIAALVVSGCSSDSAPVGSTALPATTMTMDTSTTAPGLTTSSTAAATAPMEVIPIDPGPLQGRFGHSVAWTGAEVIVWGGHSGSLTDAFSDGAAYNPDTDEWRTIAEAPLDGMTWHFAAWSGSEMLVVGTAGAAAYEPTSDSWRLLPTPPIPIHRVDEDVTDLTEYAWSGRHLYVWNPISDELARLDPSASEWEVMAGPGLNVFPAKIIAEGDRMLVFGTRWPSGLAEPVAYELFGAELADGTWVELPPIDFLTDSHANVAVPGTASFVGEFVLVWGDPGPESGDARLLHLDGKWSSVPPPPIDGNILHPRPIPLGDGRVLALSEGGNAAIWEPHLNDWTSVGSLPGILGAREAAWTGHEIIAWSGGESRWWRWVPPPPPGATSPAPGGLSEMWQPSERCYRPLFHGGDGRLSGFWRSCRRVGRGRRAEALCSRPCHRRRPQLPPVLLGQTKATNLGTGQVVKNWQGSFYSSVYELDRGRALIGVAGGAIYLVSSP